MEFFVSGCGIEVYGDAQKYGRRQEAAAGRERRRSVCVFACVLLSCHYDGGYGRFGTGLKNPGGARRRSWVGENRQRNGAKIRGQESREMAPN